MNRTKFNASGSRYASTMSVDTRKPVMPDKVKAVLTELMPLCRDLTLDEMAWITFACLKYTAMKIDGRDQQPVDKPA